MMAILGPRWPLPNLLAVALATPFGCSETAPGPRAKGPTQVRVAAASDLQGAMPVLAAAFKQETGIEVVATFGASGQLAQQIRQGAPFDIFLSANRSFVERLIKSGQVEANSVRPYARGRLAIVVNPTFALKIKSLEDLKVEKIKSIAIANTETAPYGIAAKQALEKAGLWTALKPKIVPAESVRQALQFVASGNAEVGLVGQAMADTPGLEVVPLPLDVCDPIIQVLGLVEVPASQHDEGQAFSDFLLGETGQGILRDLGFAKVSPSASKHP